MEQAGSVQEISNLTKLRGKSNYYRIRAGDYRLGIIVEGDLVTFVRCLNRSQDLPVLPLIHRGWECAAREVTHDQRVLIAP